MAESVAAVRPPPTSEQAATFQSLFDAGAFEPTTNEGKAPVERYRPDADQHPARDTRPAQQQQVAPEPVEEEVEQPVPAKPAEQEQPEEPEYQDLDEFLSKHKLDPESFRGLKVNLKVDGEERQAPLAELIKNYQLESAITQRSQKFAEQQKAWETEQNAARELYRQQLTNSKTYLEAAYNELAGDYAKIDWNALKVQDPMQFLLKQQEFQNRDNQIKTLFQQVTQTQQAEQERARQALLENLPKERAKMLEARPEWKDEAKFSAAREAMKAAGRKLGFSEAELGGITDHRVMLALDMAASYAALQASAPEALKKVRAAPVMPRPGARQGRDPQQVARQQAIERFNRNPRDIDAQAALFQTLVT